MNNSIWVSVTDLKKFLQKQNVLRMQMAWGWAWSTNEMKMVIWETYNGT